MKKCTKCNNDKQLEDFYKKKKSNGEYGYKAICKECEKLNRKEHHKKNKDKRNENNKQWRKNNSEHIKQYSKEWLEKNKDNHIEYQKHYRETTKEQTNDKIRQLFDMDKSDKLYVTYLIKSSNFFKLGYTTNLNTRLGNLKTVIDIENVYIINKNIEGSFKKKHKDFRFKSDICFGGSTECFSFTSQEFDLIIKQYNFKLFV